MLPVPDHYPLSQGWASFYADIIIGGELVRSEALLSGDVTDDSTAAVRRRCSVVLSGDAEDASIPSATYDRWEPTLWPVGNLLSIRCVVDYFGRHEDLVLPLGTFRLSKPVVADNGRTREVSVDGYDISYAIGRSRITDYWSIPSNTPSSDAVRMILRRQAPWLRDDDMDIVPTDGSRGLSSNVPAVVMAPTDDPWEICRDIARASGCELFVDRHSRVVMRPIPDQTTTPPMFDLGEGSNDSVVEASRTLDEDLAYSGVVVTGESSSAEAPVRGEAWDTNILSPTYYDPTRPGLSRFGAVPYFITSQFVTTTAQALSAARANLPRVVGIMEKVELTSLANYSLDSSDVVSVGRDRIKIDGNFAIESLQMGIGSDAVVSVSARGRQLGYVE